MRASDQLVSRSDQFERLFRAHYPAVAAYVGRRVAPDVVDDLVDDVFLVVWRRLERVPENPLPWLLAVARNVLGTHFRGARRGDALSARLATIGIDAISTEVPTAEIDIGGVLAAMRPKDREAILLVCWEELSPSEAARVLGDSATAFRVRLHRARARFRALVEQQGHESVRTIATPVPARPTVNATKEAPDA